MLLSPIQRIIKEVTKLYEDKYEFHIDYDKDSNTETVDIVSDTIKFRYVITIHDDDTVSVQRFDNIEYDQNVTYFYNKNVDILVSDLIKTLEFLNVFNPVKDNYNYLLEESDTHQMNIDILENF